MTFVLRPSQTIADCKIKRVYPAFRSVSTPQGTQDLLGCGSVNLKMRSARL